MSTVKLIEDAEKDPRVKKLAKLLTSPEVKKELTKEKAIKSMKEGIKEKDSDKLAMKSFSEKLSAAEIIERSAALTRRDQALVALYENAVSRDPSGAG